MLFPGMEHEIGLSAGIAGGQFKVAVEEQPLFLALKDDLLTVFPV